MKTHNIFFNKFNPAACLLVFALTFSCYVQVNAQNATAATPLGIGIDGCGGGTEGMRELTYNSTTNVLANTIPMCVPSLSGPAYWSYYSSVAFNPADHLFYYIQIQPNGGNWNSYVFRWDPYTCPGPNLTPYQTYVNQFIAGIAFDKNGIGWQINFTGGAPYGLELQRIDFAAGTVGAPIPISLPAAVTINQQSGDVEMTPSGQFFAVFDNKLIAINYQDYGVNPLQATFINTLAGPPGATLVALAYTDGKFLGHLSGGGCYFEEINILTGATSLVSYGGAFSATDFTNIATSIGVAKSLASANPTGTPGVYNVGYNVRVENLGNVPDSNIQVTDDLGAINGAGNVSNVSLSWVGTPPPGFTLNSGFNGVSDKNLLIASSTNVLNNIPVIGKEFTIRINLRLSGVIPGVVYNNAAAASATGYRGAAVQDVSTNGNNPDLNSNDKADDAGEAQPTPFVVLVSPETPPCTSLSSILYKQDFGTGTGLSPTMPGLSKSEYTGSTTVPLPIETFALSNNANNGEPSRWINTADHTGNANGRMMLVNADILGNKMFVDTVDVLCANLKYSLFSYVSFLGNPAYGSFCDAFGGFKFPKLTFAVRNAADQTLITNFTTGDITNNAWTLYGLKFAMPAGVTRVIIEIYNAGEGGCGNDIALDDIQFGLCDPQPVISVNGLAIGCIGSSTTINGNLSDTTGIGAGLVYQWQSSTNNVLWTDIVGATTPNLTINPITPADGIYYRLIVATAGNINSSTCRYISNSFLLGLKIPSAVPTAIVTNRSVLCPGDPIALHVTGGTLGTNAMYTWYSGTCGGTPIGTGATITVTPLVVTTYYVRIEGDCNTTACIPLTITFNCDIDADDDGIPDVTESLNVDPKLDDDFDGIPNWRDADYPGFVDSNADGVNDNFDSDKDGVPNFLDLDSDNDGIPDTVESGGVDANGDGKIDNYTDTDGDGFSQNVDANNTGHLTSGNGLGLRDTDGDGIPNCLDLDSDNDGIPDVREALGTDANNDGRIDGFTDTDQDGLSDNVDSDVGNDGIAENVAKGLLRTGADINNDGRADSWPYKNMDGDSKANPYDLDSDNDGICDVREAQFIDVDYNGRIDGSMNSNGWCTTVASMPSLILPNTDNNGLPNVYDIDSDNDGIPDNVEGLTTIGYQLPAYADSDGDGIDNAYDNYVGFGGDGIHPVDTDGDGTPDYLDLDTDGDGLPDIIEGNDLNLNGLPDDNIILTGLDTDGDGLDNFFDNDNTSVKATSRYMGNGGTTSGQNPPGSITTVQRTANSFGCPFERDWRCIFYLLNCDLTTFTVLLNDQATNLSWTVLCDQPVDHFIIERSTDRVNFISVGTIQGRAVVNAAETYSLLDNIQLVSADVIYYRLKTVSRNGKEKLSQVIQVKRSGKNILSVQIFPNPVKDQLQVQVNSPVASLAMVQIMDGSGKLLQRRSASVAQGNNTLSYPLNLPMGMYYLRIDLGHEIISKKFYIAK